MIIKKALLDPNHTKEYTPFDILSIEKGAICTNQRGSFSTIDPDANTFIILPVLYSCDLHY